MLKKIFTCFSITLLFVAFFSLSSLLALADGDGGSEDGGDAGDGGSEDGGDAVDGGSEDGGENTDPVDQGCSGDCGPGEGPHQITVTISQSSETSLVNEAHTVSWSSTEADQCTLEKSVNGGAFFFRASGISGTFLATPAQLGTHTWRARCSATDGRSGEASLNHQVVAPQNPSPIGFLDGADCNVISGWSCDSSDFNSAINIHFYVDGPAGVGTIIGSTTANQPREAAVGAQCGGNSNHGFSTFTPTSLKDGRAHTIYAYAINTPSAPLNNPLLSGAQKSFQCNGSPTNRAPVIDFIGTKFMIEGQTIDFPIVATDPDGDAVTLSVTNLPSGATFTNGRVRFTASFSQSGTYRPTASASDGRLTTNLDFFIVVADVCPDCNGGGGGGGGGGTTGPTISTPTNRAPVLNAIGNKMIEVGKKLMFMVTGSDPDSNPLTFSAFGLPQGASFSGQVFSWIPTLSQKGNNQATFRVSDGSLSASETITINVFQNDLNRVLIHSVAFPDEGYIASGEEMLVLVSLQNDGTNDLDDIRLRAFIMDEGITIPSDPFDLDAGDMTSKNLLFKLPRTVDSGWHTVGFSVYNGDIRRVVYREIYVA